MNRSFNQPTLREFLRPVRAHRVLLGAVILLAVVGSVGYSATRKPVYDSQASLAYHDETYDLAQVGLSAPTTQTADQLAAVGASTIVQPVVAAHVKTALHSPLSTDQLLSSVSASVEPNSNLVDVQASAASAAQAQQLANAFAAAGAAAFNVKERSGYAAEYRGALKQLRARGAPHPDVIAQQQASQDLSRLRVLSLIATPAQVITPAQLPSAPSSPRPIRDAALAAVLGLVLGLLVVYVRDALDRRLRTLSDVEQQFAMPMLGHVRIEALGRSPRGNGNGNGNGNLAGVDWELFRILRRNLDFLEPEKRAQVIAVTSSLPEEGKSTVASFLAFTSAAAGMRTLLVECDLRRPVFAKRLGVQQSPGLSDFALGSAEPAEILQVVPFGDPVSGNGFGPKTNGNGAAGSSAGSTRHQHQLVCITAGTPTQHPVAVIRSEALSAMLTEVRQAYDLVVLDTPPLLSVVDTLELLPHADAAVVCVRVFRTTRRQAGAGKAALKRLPARPTGLVVTGMPRDSDAEYAYYGYYS